MSERPPRERTRVLLVDDDPAFRNLGVEALGRWDGLAVEAVPSPRDALDALRERAVDAVVSDVDMPGADGDGRDLYRAVRERWPALPFVFFTGTPVARLAGSVDVRRDGAVGYVRKGSLPTRYDVLARRVERTVESGPPSDRGEAAVVRAIARFCR